MRVPHKLICNCPRESTIRKQAKKAGNDRRADGQTRQTDRQGRRTDREASKYTQKNRQTDRGADRKSDRLRSRQINTQTDRQTDRVADRQTEEQTGRQTDRQRRRLSRQRAPAVKNSKQTIRIFKGGDGWANPLGKKATSYTRFSSLLSPSLWGYANVPAEATSMWVTREYVLPKPLLLQASF